MSLGKAGKRTLKRRAVNKRLVRMFVEQGLPEVCEIKLEGCQRTWALSWAHSKKGRDIVTEDDWEEAALSCQHCHFELDNRMSKEEMYTKVTNAIAKRGEVVESHPA